MRILEVVCSVDTKHENTRRVLKALDDKGVKYVKREEYSRSSDKLRGEITSIVGTKLEYPLLAVKDSGKVIDAAKNPGDEVLDRILGWLHEEELQPSD